MSTMTLSVVRDTFASSNSPDTNYSNTASFEFILSVSDMAFYQFSLDSVLTAKKINKATLNLYVKSDQGQFLNSILAARYVCDPDALDRLTYSNKNSIGTEGSYTQKSINTQLTSSVTAISVDVTDLVTGAISDESITFSIKSQRAAYTYMAKEGGYTAQLAVEYEDIAAVDPTIIGPSDIYIKQGNPVNFSWIYNSESVATQASALLEWKKADDSSWTVINIVGDSENYQLDSTDMPIGLIDWRVKTTDSAGQQSGYATAQFTIIGKPGLPVITDCKNAALTEIKWNAVEQDAFEIYLMQGDAVLDYCRRSTRESAYRPNLFLEDGTYEVRLQVMNQYNIWSGHTSKMFTVSSEKPEKPTITAAADLDSIVITAIYTTEKAALYRSEDGKKYDPIAIIEETEYRDEEVKPGINYLYFLRAYEQGYMDSDTVSGKVFYDGIVISGEAGKVSIRRSTEEFIPFVESRSNDSQLIHYAGRKNPVRECGEFVERTIERVLFVTEEENEILLQLMKEPVLYRDDRRRCFWADMAGYSIENAHVNRGYTVSLLFTEIDHDSEVVLNEVIG